MLLAALLSGTALGLLNLAHCAGMCGPLAAVSCERNGRTGLLRYQLGRTSAYAFAGALSGHFGQGLVGYDAPWTHWLLPLLTAAACLVAAARLLRDRRSSGLVQLRTSERRTGSVFATLLRLVPRDPILLGLLSVTLPCGLLAAAVLGAIATGSPERGALFMLGFASASGLAVASTALATRYLPRIGAGARRAVACVLVVTAIAAVAKPIAALSRPATAPSAGTARHACH